MTNWQRIETAPKDGTKVDLWIIPLPPAQSYRWPDSYWLGGWHGVNQDETPTHWMLVPEPPKGD